MQIVSSEKIQTINQLIKSNCSADKTNHVKPWCVYMIKTSDNLIYTGITTDIAKRWKAHLNKKGAKFFYSRQPKKLIWLIEVDGRSGASKIESKIKRLARKEKLELLENKQNIAKGFVING